MTGFNSAPYRYSASTGWDHSGNTNSPEVFQYKIDPKDVIEHATIQQVLDFLNGVNESEDGETADVVNPDEDNGIQEDPPCCKTKKISNENKIDEEKLVNGFFTQLAGTITIITGIGDIASTDGMGLVKGTATVTKVVAGVNATGFGWAMMMMRIREVKEKRQEAWVKRLIWLRVVKVVTGSF